MKRFTLILAVFLMLSGCAQKHKDIMYIEPAQLTQEEQNIADLLGADTNQRIFDFFVDGTVQSMQINTYELMDGEWSLTSGGGGYALSDSKGRIALGFDRISGGLRVAVQSEKEHSSTSWNGLPEDEELNLGCVTSTLNDRTELVYEQEIPLVVQIETSKNEIRSYDVSYFDHPEEYAQYGYEHIYAITICFSQQTLS